MIVIVILVVERCMVVTGAASSVHPIFSNFDSIDKLSLAGPVHCIGHCIALKAQFVVGVVFFV